VCVVVRGQEASCLRCEAVPIIGLKLPGVELATEKTDPSHCLSGKKKEFSVFLFSIVFIFMCVYLRAGGPACDGNHSVCFRLLPVEL
jgi:hypothetical protein